MKRVNGRTSMLEKDGKISQNDTKIDLLFSLSIDATHTHKTTQLMDQKNGFTN